MLYYNGREYSAHIICGVESIEFSLFEGARINRERKLDKRHA